MVGMEVLADAGARSEPGEWANSKHIQIRVMHGDVVCAKRFGLVQCPPLANLSDFRWIEAGGAERS
jgi:hypothetical protein